MKPVLTPQQERAVEDARDILNAADLLFVMVFGVHGTNVGVLTNIETNSACGAMVAALDRMTNEESIFTPFERAQ